MLMRLELEIWMTRWTMQICLEEVPSSTPLSTTEPLDWPLGPLSLLPQNLTQKYLHMHWWTFVDWGSECPLSSSRRLRPHLPCQSDFNVYVHGYLNKLSQRFSTGAAIAAGPSEPMMLLNIVPVIAIAAHVLTPRLVSAPRRLLPLPTSLGPWSLTGSQRPSRPSWTRANWRGGPWRMRRSWRRRWC